MKFELVMFGPDGDEEFDSESETFEAEYKEYCERWESYFEKQSAAEAIYMSKTNCKMDEDHGNPFHTYFGILSFRTDTRYITLTHNSTTFPSSTSLKTLLSLPAKTQDLLSQQDGYDSTADFEVAMSLLKSVQDDFVTMSNRRKNLYAVVKEKEI